MKPKHKPGNQKEIMSEQYCSKYYSNWFCLKIYCFNRCIEYHLQSFKIISPFYKTYPLFHMFCFRLYPFHLIKKCFCVSQLHVPVKILSSMLETIYIQNHANYKRELHPAMSILLIIIYHWWTPAGVAFGFGGSLGNVCVLDN